MRYAVLILILLMTMPLAVAQPVSNNTTPIILTTPTILPNNPLYPIKIFFQNLEVNIVSVFNPDLAVKIQMSHIKERIAEAVAMEKMNDTAGMEKALNNMKSELNSLDQIMPRCSIDCKKEVLYKLNYTMNIINKTTMMQMPYMARHGLGYTHIGNTTYRRAIRNIIRNNITNIISNIIRHNEKQLKYMRGYLNNYTSYSKKLNNYREYMRKYRGSVTWNKTVNSTIVY